MLRVLHVVDIGHLPFGLFVPSLHILLDTILICQCLHIIPLAPKRHRLDCKMLNPEMLAEINYNTQQYVFHANFISSVAIQIIHR